MTTVMAMTTVVMIVTLTAAAQVLAAAVVIPLRTVTLKRRRYVVYTSKHVLENPEEKKLSKKSISQGCHSTLS
jgi:hypothetical protein